MGTGKNNLGKNIGYQTAYQILTVITPLITSPYLSRVLGAEQLGLFSSTYSYVCYFTLFAKLGVDTYGSRTVAMSRDSKEKISSTFFEIYVIQLVASLFSIVGYFSFVVFMMPQGIERSVSLYQGLWILTALFDINWFFFGLEEFKVTVSRNIVIKLLTVLSVITFVKSEDDLVIYIFITAGGMLLSQIILIPFLARRIMFQPIEFYKLRRHIKPLFVLFVPVLAMSVFHIMDKTMLGIFSESKENGYYYNTDRLANITIGVANGLNTVMLPRFSRIRSEKENDFIKELSYSYELTASFSIALAFGLFAVSEVFVPVFFGSSFNACIPLVKLFAPIMVIKATSEFLCQQYLIPMGKENKYIAAVVLGAIANVIFNYKLILAYGAMGATVGTLIAESTVLIAIIIQIYRSINLKYVLGKSIHYLLFGIIMICVVKLYYVTISKELSIINLFVSIIIGAISYLICCLARLYKYYKQS